MSACITGDTAGTRGSWTRGKNLKLWCEAQVYSLDRTCRAAPTLTPSAPLPPPLTPCYLTPDYRSSSSWLSRPSATTALPPHPRHATRPHAANRLHLLRPLRLDRRNNPRNLRDLPMLCLDLNLNPFKNINQLRQWPRRQLHHRPLPHLLATPMPLLPLPLLHRGLRPLVLHN